MLRRAAALATVFSMLAGTGLASSYLGGEYEGEVSYNVVESEGAAGFTFRYYELLHYGRPVKLDREFPNEVQPIVQRISSCAAYMGTVRHEAPVSDTEEVRGFYAKEYETDTLAFTAEYADGAFDYYGDTTERRQGVGIEVNYFPALAFRLGYSDYKMNDAGDTYRAAEMYSWLGGYARAARLRWDVWLSRETSDDFLDETDVESSVTYFPTDELGVELGLARSSIEDDEDLTSVRAELRFSSAEYGLRVGGLFEIDPSDDKQVYVSLRFRY